MINNTISFMLILYISFSSCKVEREGDNKYKIRLSIDEYIKSWSSFVPKNTDSSETEYRLDSLAFLPALPAVVYLARSDFFPDRPLIVLLNPHSSEIAFIPVNDVNCFAGSYPKEGVFSAIGSNMKDDFIGLEKYLNIVKPNLADIGIREDLKRIISIYFNLRHRNDQKGLERISVTLLSDWKPSSDSKNMTSYWNYCLIDFCEINNEIINFYTSLKNSNAHKNGKLIGFVYENNYEFVIVRKSSFDDFIGFHPYRVLYFEF